MRTTHITRSVSPLFLLACATLSCTGRIDDAGVGGAFPAASGGTEPRKDDVPGAGLPSPNTVMRRLTRTEYQNTLRDLLGDRSQATTVLDADPTYGRGLFDNNAETLSSVLPVLDKHDTIASQVVEKAFAPGATRARLLASGGCKSDQVTDACARPLVAAFAHRAWRRPIGDEDLGPLMTAAMVAKGDGAEEVVKLALRMSLVSPNFLYRIERETGQDGLAPIAPHELATRLSYFLWSSTPDDQLLQRADDSTLVNQPGVLAAQVARMLDDGKADALVDDFASQWLGTRLVLQVSPDKKAFPNFNDDVRAAMAAESQTFFRTFLKGERNVADMLDADFTFVNERLAAFYSMARSSNVKGATMVQVPATALRFGLLSQGGILMVTSNPDRTVVPRRGKWILSRLLCAPPGAPPPMIPTIEESAKSPVLPANPTIREVLETSHNKPECVGCHAGIDPLGFALENYNAVGGWRAAYPKRPIDASGQLDGHPFNGAHELSRVLKNDPRFLPCFARNLFAYALGREPTTEGDKAAIADLAASAAQNGGRIRDLIGLLASSHAFTRRGGTP